jgi:hypothetical protein
MQAQGFDPGKLWREGVGTTGAGRQDAGLYGALLGGELFTLFTWTANVQAGDENRFMKNEKGAVRVKLEPELEEIAAAWPVAKRFEMARKFGRWSRQLRVSAKIMSADAQGGTNKRRTLKFVGLRKAALN